MKSFAKKITNVFASGALGGFANGIVVWFFGAAGITKALGVSIAPDITPPYMYHRIVWGGIWGVLFVLPFFKRLTLLKGIVYSLAPTLVQLLVVFPVKANKGFFGYQLGLFTPLFVFIFNAVWGIVAAYWLKYVSETR